MSRGASSWLKESDGLFGQPFSDTKAARHVLLKVIPLDGNGVFQPATSNNLTLSFVEPFFALDGTATKYLHFDAGFRQEEVWVSNQDLLNPQNSFARRSRV